jgi:hypothetical protein
MAISTIALLYVWLAAEKCESIKASSETIEIICLVMITDPSRRVLGSDAQTATMTWNCIRFKRMPPGRRLRGCGWRRSRGLQPTGVRRPRTAVRQAGTVEGEGSLAASVFRVAVSASVP